MFDKYRARFAKFEEDHESVRKVTKHIEKHQILYASGATGVICILGTRTFSRPTVITNVIEQAAPIVAPVFNNHNIGNVVNTTINNAGHATKIIQRGSDGRIWEKVGDAAWEYAQELGIPLERARIILSQNINGHKPDAFGDTFRVIGLGTTG